MSSENCRKLDMIYFKSQKKFLFFLENVFKKTNGNKKWILSSIFSRDYYQSRLYLNLCYLKLIDDLYKKNGNIVPFGVYILRFIADSGEVSHKEAVVAIK